VVAGPGDGPAGLGYQGHEVVGVGNPDGGGDGVLLLEQEAVGRAGGPAVQLDPPREQRVRRRPQLGLGPGPAAHPGGDRPGAGGGRGGGGASGGGGGGGGAARRGRGGRRAAGGGGAGPPGGAGARHSLAMRAGIDSAVVGSPATGRASSRPMATRRSSSAVAI